jgi:hypothetical protein
MTTLKDYLTDLAKDAITGYEVMKNERDDLQDGDLEGLVEQLVDDCLLEIKSRLIGE